MLKVKRANPKNESPATPAADAVTASAVRSATDVLPEEQKEDTRPTWQYVLRLIGSSLLLFAIIANMVMIFLFSAESISESSDRSTGVIMKLAAILYRDYDELNWLEKEQLYSAMATPVRKLAHMAEYASLGFLTGAFLLPTRKKKRWIPWVIPAAFCLIYAASDEIHQIFSGRGPSVRDVLIDFSGAILGICLIHFIAFLVRSILRNSKKVRHTHKRKSEAPQLPPQEPAPVLPVAKTQIRKEQPEQKKVSLLLKLLRRKDGEKPAHLKKLTRDGAHQWYGNGGRFAKTGRIRHRG